MKPKRLLVAVGSRNAAKAAGAKAAFTNVLGPVTVREVDTTSLVRTQPMSLEETVEGAQERAVFAMEFSRPDFSVGVEAGLVDVGKACRLIPG